MNLTLPGALRRRLSEEAVRRNMPLADFVVDVLRQRVPSKDTDDRTWAALSSLSRLERGWDGGAGEPIALEVVVAAERFLRRWEDHLPHPAHVAPLTNGSVQLEWSVEGRSLELEFVSPAKIRWLRWQPSAGVEEEDDDDAAASQPWPRLFDWLAGEGKDGE